LLWVSRCVILSLFESILLDSNWYNVGFVIEGIHLHDASYQTA